MGLDVYLYKCDDIAAHRAWSKQLDAAEDYQAWEAANPDPAPETKVEIDSSVYPEHMFKIGYLRSSYNEGGIERVLGNLTGKGLYHIFGVSDNEYHRQPDWQECLKRAIDARDSLAKYVADVGFYGVSEIGGSPFGGPTIKGSEDAMKVFQVELAKHKEYSKEPHPFGGSYSNRDGHFYLDAPLKIVAAIEGRATLSGFAGREITATYLVYEKDDAWYRHALEITVEMIEYVLAQPDREKYVLHWSA